MNISKIICWTRPDGGLSICAPCISRDDPPEMTEGQALDRALQKDIPEGASNLQILDRSGMPSDAAFRNAWELTDGQIVVSMPKARTIHMDCIRKARNKELDRLDKEWMRAQGQGNSNLSQQVESQKQALRDLPQSVDLSQFTTPEALLSFWPEGLPLPD